tara:strand:+ start:3729 stop:3992 length:264 start_codon:yes stop_codon:yes gene_type:complete
VKEENKKVKWQPEEKHYARTTSKIAFLLIWIFIITFAIHYACIFTLSLLGKELAIEAIAQLFGMWLPVVSGFVGGAVTYYFTKRDEE